MDLSLASEKDLREEIRKRELDRELKQNKKEKRGIESTLIQLEKLKLSGNYQKIIKSGHQPCIITLHNLVKETITGLEEKLVDINKAALS